MWRDEIQAWLIARESTSFEDLFKNLKYEGHPGLWHLCLMVLVKFSDSPETMQYFQVVIATITVYVFAKYSPFSNIQKFIFAFGYYPFFEYNIISRNYGIGTLCVFIFCSMYKNRYSYYLTMSTVVFFLSHTNIFGLIVSITIFFVLLVDLLIIKVFRHQRLVNGLNTKTGLFVIIVGIFTSIMQILPPVDSGFATEWFLQFDLKRFCSLISVFRNSYLPIPLIDLHFWGSNALNGSFIGYLSAFLSAALFFLFLFMFIRKPIVLLFFIVGTFGINLFLYIKYPGTYRHHGYVYYVLIMSVWISKYYNEVEWFELSSNFLERRNILFSYAITLLFFIHMLGGLIATVMDQRYVFSAGKDVATYLEYKGMDKLPIVGYPDYAASTVVGYLDKRTFYYPQGERNGSFVRWDIERNVKVPVNDLIGKSQKISNESRKETILILNEEIPEQILREKDFRLLKSFKGAVVGDEKYFLYLFDSI